MHSVGFEPTRQRNLVLSLAPYKKTNIYSFIKFIFIKFIFIKFIFIKFIFIKFIFIIHNYKNKNAFCGVRTHAATPPGLKSGSLDHSDKNAMS